MRLAPIIAICLVPILAGCAPSIGIDAIRPVQLREPIFVVVPPNRSRAEDEHATDVERRLLSGGMRVSVRPTFKAVRIEAAGSESRTATASANTGAGGVAATLSGDEYGRVVDSFLVGDTQANYRINTYLSEGLLELIDGSNQQVLSVIPLQRVLGGPDWAKMDDILRAVGFAVAVPPEQPTEQKGRRIKRDQKEKRVPVIAAASQVSPIFTVIPSSDWLRDISFALTTERLLVRLGLHVVRPPAPRYREQSTALTSGAAVQAESGGLSASGATGASARRFETYWTHDDTAAHVILVTNSYGSNIKIIDKASKEVRSVVTLSLMEDSTGMIALRDALRAAGIPVLFEPSKMGKKPGAGT